MGPTASCAEFAACSKPPPPWPGRAGGAAPSLGLVEAGHHGLSGLGGAELDPERCGGTPAGRRCRGRAHRARSCGLAPLPLHATGHLILPPIQTVAETGEGCAELVDAIVAHRERIAATGELEARRAEGARAEMRALMAFRLIDALEGRAWAESWKTSSPAQWPPGRSTHTRRPDRLFAADHERGNNVRYRKSTTWASPSKTSRRRSLSTRDILGLELHGTEVLEDQKVKTAFLPVGIRRELLASTDPEGPIAKFIAAKGQGVQHLAFRSRTSRLRWPNSRPGRAPHRRKAALLRRRGAHRLFAPEGHRRGPCRALRTQGIILTENQLL